MSTVVESGLARRYSRFAQSRGASIRSARAISSASG